MHDKGAPLVERGGAPRIVYFGMFGPLSLAPLLGLLDAGLLVCAVIVPATVSTSVERDGTLRPLRPPAARSARSRPPAKLLGKTIVDLAWERDIPAFEVAALADATVAPLRAFAPDLIAVSCFSFKFPAALLALPPLGCLNLHPSPLPRNRGPAPLFWAFREETVDGVVQGGVTAHLMDEGLDSGPMAMQEQFLVADGATGGELELRCAAVGSGLLVAAARGLADGSIAPKAQDEAQATTYPWPQAGDFIITTDRPARWAFNFIRGTAGWGQPHVVSLPREAGGGRWIARVALAYDPAARLDAPVIQEDGENGAHGGAVVLRAQFTPGVLTFVAVQGDGR